MYKFKLGQGPVSVHKPLNYSCIRDYFKFTFRGLVADISPFDTHSLRAGGASAAANAGVPERLFQRHGRWKSISAERWLCRRKFDFTFVSVKKVRYLIL